MRNMKGLREILACCCCYCFCCCSKQKEEHVNSYDNLLWLFKGIDRREAESLLQSNDQSSGTFLIRDCLSKPGNFSLSVLSNGKVDHYRITKTNNSRFSLIDNLDFPSLYDLVEYYKQSNKGLVCPLTVPCVRQTPKTSTFAKDIWEIDRSSLTIGRKIGAGTFGDVWLAMLYNRSEVAVKTMKEGAMSREAFIAEATVMKTLRHNHILQLLAVCTDREPIYIVTEYMEKGSLLNYLRNTESAELSVRELIDIIAQVASGMAYLETMKYIHRDLAARNILVGQNNLCKVADFGLTRLLMDDEDYLTAVEDEKVPIKWLALEALMYRKFTIKSDVWSFGILMTEIITKGCVPYLGMNKNEVVQELRRGYRMERPEHCPALIYVLMKKCWSVEPSDRPSFEWLHIVLESYCEKDEYEYNDGYDESWLN